MAIAIYPPEILLLIVGTADVDATIPDEALNKVNGDESDDGLPILETNHDSASDNEAHDYDSASDNEADDNYDEVGDYSSDVSDPEPETEGDIVHPDALDPPHESMETTPTDPVEVTITPPELNQAANDRLVEITTEILSSQLNDYDCIKSTVDDDTTKSIVARSRTHRYNYLPRIFYVDKQDFDAWLEQDGHDQFFEWNKCRHRDNNPDHGARSDFYYIEVYNGHREGYPRTGQCRPRAPRREIKKQKVYKSSPKAGCTAKLIVHNMKDDSGDPELVNKGRRK
ncbi:hypothetical protein BGX27_000176 [Mortierella sp. AM989]|nr:hypothetical protein BGX27_000176 [Mortierella sp. AM989]